MRKFRDPVVDDFRMRKFTASSDLPV